jgi:hypothetical protein
MDLIPQLNTNPASQDDKAKTSSSDDQLGHMLTSKWDDWSTSRRSIEEDWLRDLRAFSQQNEPDVAQLSKFHNDIYIGLTRTKVMNGFSRVADLMFGQARDKHWTIEPTPIPENEAQDNPDFVDAMKEKAEAMERQIEDQLIDLDYEEIVKQHLLEASILGTGCIKGIVPGVKTSEQWQKNDDGEWDVVKTEVPFPQLSAPSIFNIYPDPYAVNFKDLSGIFERHVLNRQQFTELRDDPRFDQDKINEVLANADGGNHTSLYHETQRRTIASASNQIELSESGRFEVLEYWGQVSGRMLIAAGLDDIDEENTYWANVWTCASKTLFARLMPMKKQKIPYNFFMYNKVPHQFWGIGPARMMRYTQAMVNGCVRSLLDSMAMLMPQAEVNVHMLKDGQDPTKTVPGQTWLRDKGDPSIPAVRYFQPQMPTGQLTQLAEMAKAFMEDETSLPAYTYENNSYANETAKGLSMQMSAALLPIKTVVKNLEDGTIKPVIESLYDWNMTWNDDESIKGDMKANVLATSSLMAKEVKSQQLLQFLNLTANPLDIQFVDRKYLLTQLAKAVEIDTKMAIPDVMPEPENPQQPPAPSPLDQAKVQLIASQVETELVTQKKIIAETANKNIESQFSATQAAAQILANPAILPTADALLASSGYVDQDNYPIAPIPNQQQVDTGVPQNTSPQFPPNPQQPDQPEMEQVEQPGMEDMQSPMQGIETSQHETIQG